MRAQGDDQQPATVTQRRQRSRLRIRENWPCPLLDRETLPRLAMVEPKVFF